ncbi:MAG: 4-hydroxy-tetrahydrodipicolinate synthase [Planctomycetota bacterium]|jgi:4-hydroxy-tetrahydrodipicolinate synthase
MLSGLFTALVTPFGGASSGGEAIDWPALEGLVEEQLEAGVDGLVPCGTTGEASTLRTEEQLQVIRFVVERVAGRVPVLAGAGANSTPEALALTRGAQEAGADGVLSVTPCYNRPQIAGLVAHYRELASVGLPVVLYNIPARTGLGLTIDDYRRLARIPGVVGTKEASGDGALVDQLLLDGELTVLCGDDAALLPMLAQGAAGAISVASHLVARDLIDLIDLMREGAVAEAREIHRRLVPLFRALFLESNPAPLKSALARRGRIRNILRPPLAPVTERTFRVVEEACAAAGVPLPSA